MKNAQSSIELFIFLAVVTIIAISISYFIYSSFYKNVSHMGTKSYLTSAIFDNIYGNNTNIFISLKMKQI
jgi:uncharacterized protein (UPF0333 family)